MRSIFKWKNPLFMWLGLFICGILLVVAVTFIFYLTKPSPFANLKGRYLAVISDGDFFASTYSNGRIPNSDSRYQDALTLIPLPFDGNASASSISLNVSNSVNGPPEALALSPNRNIAFVVDYLGQRGAGAITSKDLPPGRLLTMVDVKNPRQPRIIDSTNVGRFLEAIDVHPSGKWIALATDSSQSEVLQIVPINDSRLGTPINIALDTLGIPTAKGLLNASYVEWHPSGKYLALNLYRQNRIVFLEFSKDAASGNCCTVITWKY
jgi:hypothetical protein